MKNMRTTKTQALCSLCDRNSFHLPKHLAAHAIAAKLYDSYKIKVNGVWVEQVTK